MDKNKANLLAGHPLPLDQSLFVFYGRPVWWFDYFVDAHQPILGGVRLLQFLQCEVLSANGVAPCAIKASRLIVANLNCKFLRIKGIFGGLPVIHRTDNRTFCT